MGNRATAARSTCSTARATPPPAPASASRIITFYVVLVLEGSNDIVAKLFKLSINDLTIMFRILVFVLPVLAFLITKRIALGLQRKDRELVLHGHETGRIVRFDDGEYIEVHEPLTTKNGGFASRTTQPQATRIGARAQRPRGAPQGLPLGSLQGRLVALLLRGPGGAGHPRTNCGRHRRTTPTNWSASQHARRTTTLGPIGALAPRCRPATRVPIRCARRFISRRRCFCRQIARLDTGPGMVSPSHTLTI